VFFDEGLDVDKEFSHGGDDDAFVGFTAVAQALHIGCDDGVAVCGGVRCHVEASAHFGMRADD